MRQRIECLCIDNHATTPRVVSSEFPPTTVLCDHQVPAVSPPARNWTLPGALSVALRATACVKLTWTSRCNRDVFNERLQCFTQWQWRDYTKEWDRGCPIEFSKCRTRLTALSQDPTKANSKAHGAVTGLPTHILEKWAHRNVPFDGSVATTENFICSDKNVAITSQLFAPWLFRLKCSPWQILRQYARQAAPKTTTNAIVVFPNPSHDVIKPVE